MNSKYGLPNLSKIPYKNEIWDKGGHDWDPPPVEPLWKRPCFQSLLEYIW